MPDININLVLAWLDPGTTYFNLGSMDAAPMILSSIAALVGTEFSYGRAAKQTCWMSQHAGLTALQPYYRRQRM